MTFPLAHLTAQTQHPEWARGVTGVAPRILLACGGTGGHVYPAIAIADALRARHSDAVIAFAGTRERMEWEAVPKAGYPIHPVTVSGFQRGFSIEALRRNAVFPLKLGKGLVDAWGIVRTVKPDVVVGTGGYVAGPVGLAADLRGVPLVIQEQNAYAGATNRLLARRAAHIFVAFEAAREAFADVAPEGTPITVAGNPVRRDLIEADRAAALTHFNFAEDARVLLVMGGSLGAGPINGALKLHLEALLEDQANAVIWAAGTRYFDALHGAVPDHPRVRLVPYLDRMDLAYAAADLALTRAGAITCSELTATGTPAVLVPSPNVTADHQTRNAAALADAGAAVLLPEPALDARFESTILPLLADAGRRGAMQEAARSLAYPEAAAQIAGAVCAFCRRSHV